MLMKAKFNKLFTLLTILTLGITQLWAADPVENVGTYSTQVISADGTTSTWTFITPGSQVTIPTSPAETEDNDIIFHPGGGSKMKFSSSNGLSWSGNSDGYIYVPAGAAGSISMTVKSESNSRWLQLYVGGEDQGSTKRLWSKEANPATDARGPRTFTFTSSDLTTKGTKTYLHLKDNNTELKIATFTVTLTTGNYLSSGGGEDPVCPSGLSITSKNDKTAFLEGDAIELTAALTAGNGAITYQWYKGGTAEGNKLTGKTAAKLEIASCVEGDAGDYYCVASKSDCSDAVNADAFTITVAHNPCATHHWFVATADATANGKTNWDGFTNAVTGSNGQSNSVTIDGTTYTLTKRTGSTGGGGTILGFTIPANKAGTLYGYMKSSGSAARVLSLKKGDDVVMTNNEIGTGGNWTLITMSNIAPGTYTLSPDQNVQVQMFALKVCDATFHTITLDLDGGTGATSIQALDGVAATKPADPTKDHCAFAGWYSGVDAYDWTTVVTAPFTLTAHWTQLYTISFANGGGSGDAPAAIADKAQGETFQVPANTFTAPSASQEFDIWNDGTNDYAPGATYTVGTENVILTAQWKALVAKYTVIFKDGETTLDTKLVDVGSNPSDAGVDKTKALSTFAAWQKDAADIALDDAFWATVAANAEITLTARWTKAFAANIDFEAFIDVQTTSGNWQAELAAKNYAISSTTSVTLDAPDGKPADKGLKIKNSGAYISFNVNAGKLVLLKAGVLSGAEASVDGGANYTALTGASGSTGASVVTPLYNATEAEYRIRTTTGSYNIIQSITITNPYTVTFEAHGDADPTPLQGTPSVTLPTPTNGTASFTGWFDAETGGNKIGDAGETYTPTADITLHAQWETVSTDARLASITFSAVGTLSPAFNPEVVNYTYTMPYPTASVPTITGATAVNANAQASVIDVQAANWGDVAQIHGVAESGDTKNYYITMKLAPKDGICLVWADVPADNTLTYNSTNSKIYAESDVTLVNSNVRGKDGSAPSGKKFQANGYLKLELTAGTFKAGDIVALNVTYGTANVMHVYKAQTATAADVIGEATGNTDAGLNMVAITEDATTLWLVRGGDYADWNPHVDYVAVYRPMNPILNKITVNGVEGTPDALNAITIEVPASTTQSELEAIVYDWISNSDAWTANPANAPVATNAWAFGVANTVTLTDKDGDASVYTVTVNKAAVSTDATLASLTVNGQAVTLVPGQFTYDVELPHGISVAPTVVATANHPAAVATVDPCTLSGATITVVPESGAGDQKVYTLNFTINPWAEVVIWDGSTMTEVATSPIADLEWTVNGFGGIANYNATCGTKAYTKCLKSGGAASASRNVELVVPTGYIAKFYIVVGTHEDGTERGMFIGTAATKTLDASSILEINNSVRTEPSAGTSEIAGAGTWYINPEASVDFYEIRVLLRPGYARTAMLGNGVLGTICVPNNVAFEDIHGATFYELSGKNAEGKIAFDQITTGQLEAGVPYVFQANGDKLVLFYGNEHEDNPQDLHNGMYGTFTDLVLTELDDVYYFAQKALWSCTDLTNLSIPANRAYVKLSEIPSAMAPAPGRIRMTLNVNGAPQVTTGMEEITNDQSQMTNKVIIDGRLYILRGEKLYDATGKLVK